MPKNQNSLNVELFKLLLGRGYDLTMLNTAGDQVPVPDEADVFQFHFHKDGVDYGTVTVSIDGLHKLMVYFGDKVADSPKEQTNDPSWYKVLKNLKSFAQKHQLSFEISNMDKLKYDMSKRTHTKKLDEAYHAMGKKASYSDNVPSVKMIIKHTRQIEEGEQRYRNIERIFVETIDGERFLLPTNKPGLGRVYARHIAEGGKVNDDRWGHINNLVEDYSKMAGFVRATRNNTNESVKSLVESGLNHYSSLRETLSKLAGKRGYNTYFENWTPTLNEDNISQPDLSEMFKHSTLDPRIESALPILSKITTTVNEMTEINEFEQWTNDIIEENLLPHNKSEFEDLAELLSPNSDPLVVGVDGINAKLVLKDLLDDDSLTDELESLADTDPDSDAKETILNWLHQSDDHRIHKLLDMIGSTQEQNVAEEQKDRTIKGPHGDLDITHKPGVTRVTRKNYDTKYHEPSIDRVPDTTYSVHEPKHRGTDRKPMDKEHWEHDMDMFRKLSGLDEK